MIRRRSLLLPLLAALLAAVAASAAAATHAAGDPTNPRDLPLGDGHVSTTTPTRGSVYECSVMNGGGGGKPGGPWIHADGTFDETAKPVVAGAVTWPGSVSFVVSGSRLLVRGNGLPFDVTTGVFPVAADDPASAWDRNPNSIAAQTISWSLPAKPKPAARPSCLSGGPIGIAVDGVAIFDALDNQNRDAVAHELQDSCQGHPERTGMYHYHSIPACIYDADPSGLVGYALDGYPIFGPRDSVTGKLLTDADLDACHGRTSWVTLRGRRVRTYHYNATLEYPYTLGCFHGTPLRVAGSAGDGGGGGGRGGPPHP